MPQWHKSRVLQDATCESGPKRSGGDRRASPASGPRCRCGPGPSSRAAHPPRRRQLRQQRPQDARGSHRTGPSNGPPEEASRRRARRAADRQADLWLSRGEALRGQLLPHTNENPPAFAAPRGPVERGEARNCVIDQAASTCPGEVRRIASTSSAQSGRPHGLTSMTRRRGMISAVGWIGGGTAISTPASLRSCPRYR